jgi:phosphate starvation-inducible PhoH-like protein
VITGDVTQVDLPRGQPSGLRQAVEVLKDVDGISFTFFNARDVVRHALVQRIVHAYEAFDRPEPLSRPRKSGTQTPQPAAGAQAPAVAEQSVSGEASAQS